MRLEFGLLRPVGGICDRAVQQLVEQGLLLPLDLEDLLLKVAVSGYHIRLAQLPDLHHVPAELAHQGRKVLGEAAQQVAELLFKQLASHVDLIAPRVSAVVVGVLLAGATCGVRGGQRRRAVRAANEAPERKGVIVQSVAVCSLALLCENHLNAIEQLPWDQRLELAGYHAPAGQCVYDSSAVHGSAEHLVNTGEVGRLPLQIGQAHLDNAIPRVMYRAAVTTHEFEQAQDEWTPHRIGL